MHLATNMKHWSHLMHDDMLAIWHGIDGHLHSRRFWIGVGAALLIIGLMTLLLIMAWRMPAGSFEGFEYGIPYPHYRI